MKNILLISVLCLSVTVLLAENEVTYKTIVPKELKKYRPGSTLQENEKNLIKAYTDADHTFGFRKEYVIKNPTKKIKEVTLYFDDDDDQPLYEYIIDYNEPGTRDAFTAATYGQPNINEDEWEWTMPDGYTARAWTFMNKLVIAIAYPNSEWEDEWGIRVKP